MDGWTYKQAWIHRTRILERIHAYGLLCTNPEIIIITFKKMKKSTWENNITSTVWAYLGHLADLYWVSS